MDTPLKRIRKRRGITQRVVAEQAGIRPAYYCRIENGTSTASAEVAANIARYFGGVLTELEILYPKRFVTQNEAA